MQGDIRGGRVAALSLARDAKAERDGEVEEE